MDAARQVVERLRRIEELRGADAEAGRLLGELRALLSEGQAWLAAERAAGIAGIGSDVEEHEASLRRAGDSLASLDEEFRLGAALTAPVQSSRAGRYPARSTAPPPQPVADEAISSSTRSGSGSSLEPEEVVTDR
jgi:hypothetical protein